MTPASHSSVRVAVRVRPMSTQESDSYQDRKEVIDFIPNEPQIVVGQKQSFTFDHVYPPATEQVKVYETCVIPLVYNFLEGYNATVLAYGQTGAGKSFSMGIGLDSFVQKSNEGIVPRFIDTLFDQLAQKHGQNSTNYHISVSFLELHNEDLIDLLSPGVHTLRKENQPMVVIREDSNGAICWSGIREERVTTPHQLLCLLEKGSVARTTAATDMNISSSRSHAIFSIQLRQTPDDQQGKTITSKFHFVDLAGSERLKRTNAVGHRAKEGISINSGLLALGNVISALGDESRRSSHIPYRDSKLTRLLQDSLGGNSQTLMLACVSPAWSNLKETLSTLKYANRARNIRNRVAINQEMDTSQGGGGGGEQVKKLKSVICKLRQELRSNDEFMHAVNDEMDGLKAQVEALKGTITSLVQEKAQLKYQSDSQNPSSVDPSFNDLAQEYAYTIEELKVQIVLLQQEKQHQHQMVLQKPPTPPPEPTAPMMSRAGSKHSQYGKDSINRKKKRHSFRVGSKKMQRSFSSIRKRQSQNNLVAPPLPPRAPQLQKELAQGKKDDWKRLIHQQMSDVHNDVGYVDSKKSSILGNPNWSADLIRKSFKDMMTFSSSFPLENTLHVSESNIHLNSHYGGQPTPSNDLAHIVQRYGESLERQQKFIYSIQSMAIPNGGATPSSSQDQSKQEAALRKQHKRELDDLKRQTDQELKKHLHEHQALKRHYQQLVISTERSRTQHNTTVLSLKQKLEILTRDKKKLVKKSKQDADRARDRSRQLEKQVQKLERQEVKATHLKKRLERDLHGLKQTAKHTKEDMATLAGQLTSVAMMIQKVLQQQGSKKLATSDRALLAKAVACARVRGYLVTQKHGGGSGRRGVASLQQRILQKKQLIHRAIDLYVKAYMPEQKCSLNLLPEQKRITHHDDSDDTKSDDSTWMDDAPFWTTDDAQVAYENILILVRTLEPEETRSVLETMVHHILHLETVKYQDVDPIHSLLPPTPQHEDPIHRRHSLPQNHPQPSVSAAIRRSGLPTPRRSSCK